MIEDKHISTFFLALPSSLIGFAAVWALVAPGHLYYCWDDCPPLAISWFPPFIHPWANTADGKLRDYFVAPEWVVYLVWSFFIVGAFLVPVLIAWVAGRHKARDDIA